MSASPLQSCPYRTPLLDASGQYVTLPWVQWFDSLFSASSSTQASVDSSDTDVATQISLADFQQLVDQAIVLRGDRADAGRLDLALAELERQISDARSHSARLRPDVDDLHLQLALASGYNGQENGRIVALETAVALLQDSAAAAAAPPVVLLVDTHAHRVTYAAAGYPGALYLESDTTLVYASIAGQWIYQSGAYEIAQASIAAYAATLGASDAGTIIEEPFFCHRLQWQGTGFAWAPGDRGSGEIAMFLSAPAGPGWHACDGSSVTYLLSNGSTASQITQDFGSVPAYPKFSSLFGVRGSAIAPGINATNDSGAGVTINNPASGGTPVAVAVHPHNHSDTADTFGEPARFSVVPFFRI